MAIFKWTLSFAAIAVVAVGLTGCGNSQPSNPDSTTPAIPMSDDMDHEGMASDSHEGHDHAAHDEGAAAVKPAAKTDMEKMNETLANFSEEDRKSALKQHFCPISGEMLGVMGKPEKVDVNGQTVWICCDGCKDKLLADPEKYLAKINK
ncbi:hypothetical protein SH528x_005215 [Novipirellula sp. SH528]|uniref:hypothetical protein n=1 Tax=Novipirellula sp. SH528 TaxID=3454466 RepID=UPI003F9F132B